MSTAYAEPVELADALAAVSSGARPVAGGTDLVVGARQGKAGLPDSLVAIHRLPELRGIAEHAGGLRLAALVSHEEIVADARVRERYTAICSWIREVSGRSEDDISVFMSTGLLLAVGAAIDAPDLAGDGSFMLRALGSQPSG